MLYYSCMYIIKKQIVLSILFTCMFSASSKSDSSNGSSSHQNCVVVSSAAIADTNLTLKEEAVYFALRNIYPGIEKNPDNDETRHELNAAWEEFRKKIPVEGHSLIKNYVVAEQDYNLGYADFKMYMDRFLSLEELRDKSLAKLNFFIHNFASYETKNILQQIRSFCKNKKKIISDHLLFFKDRYKYEKEGFKDIITAFKNSFSIEDPIMKCSISDFHIDNSDDKKLIIEQIEEYKVIAQKIHEFVNSINLDPIFNNLIYSKSCMDYFHKEYNSIKGIPADFPMLDSEIATCKDYLNTLENFQNKAKLKACSRHISQRFSI